ncbi:MAG: glycosyl transferase, partial [Pseudomonadales bacterium]
MTVLWLSPIAGILSYVLTRLLIGYAITHRVVDIPNDRSSHNRSVPRGGGLAIALSFQACLFVCWATELIATNFMIALSGSGGLVALIGFIDDHRSVPVGWRLTVHFLAAAVALFSLGGVPELRIFGVIFSAGWQSSVLGAIAIVWFLNLYNFMDGTDLLAGIEAGTVCIAGALLCLWTSPGAPTWMVPMLLAASVAGFLCWNLPPAKVFMGDVGSGFLGVTLAIIALQAGW